jgi:hypothetical protein
MNTQCCDPFAAMEPARQAEYLTLLAQEARLLEFALQGEGIEARNARVNCNARWSRRWTQMNAIRALHAPDLHAR